jgi:hypothetical protein
MFSRIGYDSLGAGCIINHLHFEMIFLDDFSDINCLPIEKSEPKLIFSTRFKNKDEEEISIFDENTHILVSMIFFPVFCWKVQAIEIEKLNEELISESNFQDSIAHCTNMFLTHLIDSEIPHNLIISDKGRSFYIIPRKFDNTSFPINTCWNDLAGLITIRDEEALEGFSKSEEEINNFLMKNVSLDEVEFKTFTEKITANIETIYVIEKF